MGLREHPYSVKEFADILGIPKGDLLKKEKGGDTPPAKRDTRGNRYYTPRDILSYRAYLCLPPIKLKHKQLFLNFKGGTGKSSISASYGFRLAEMGFHTLLIDLDPQGHLTKCLGFNSSKYHNTLYEVLIKEKDIRDAIIKTGITTLNLLPSNPNLSRVELSLSSLYARCFRLKRSLRSVEDTYDLIVMDASPSDSLLNLNAILACNDLLVPVLADFLSYHGLKLLFDTIAPLKDDFSFTFSHIYVILNKYNASRNICLRSKEALERYYSDYLVKTIVRQDTKIAEAASHGVPIFQYAPSSKGAKDIQSLINEVFDFKGGENV